MTAWLAAFQPLGLLGALWGMPQIRWSAPPSCPSEQEMTAEVQRLLGPDSPGQGDANITVERDGGHYRARVTMTTSAGTATREFAGPACDSVAKAAALAVAGGLDPAVDSAPELEFPDVPEVVAPPDPQPARVPAQQVSPPAVRVRPPNVSEVSPEPPREVTVRGWLYGGLAGFLLPGLGGDLAGGLAVSLGAFRIEGGGLWTVPRRFEHRDAQPAGALITVGAARLGGCWSGKIARFSFPLCLTGEVGATTARGRALENRATRRSWWAAAVPQARGLWFPRRWVGLGVSLEVPISLTRAGFSIDDVSSDIVKVGILGVRGGLFVEFVFFDEINRRRR